MEWTDKDRLRAADEGWAYRNGYVTRLFSAGAFYSPFEVVAHLRKKGRTSQWHREVYLNLPWTDADEQLAREDGWRLTYGTIIRSNAAKFASDEEAQELVHKQACASPPDPLCIKALARMAKRRLLEGADY